MNKPAWRKNKAKLNRVYKIINVKAENIRVAVNGNRATVRFVQLYRSDWHRDRGIKTLHMLYHSGRWKIASEQWEPLEKSAKNHQKRQ